HGPGTRRSPPPRVPCSLGSSPQVGAIGCEAGSEATMFMAGSRCRPRTRFLSLTIATLVGSLPLSGCGRSNESTSAPSPYGGPGPGAMPQRKGLSTGQKVAILAGAAALYYLYNKHKNAQGTGKQGQYYLSKNGRVYYRDPKTH